MRYIIAMMVLMAAVFVSFKMAEEKLQNKFIWSGATLFIGPLVIIVQYLVAYINGRNLNKKSINI